MMLHIHNGDSTANTLRTAGFPGTHFAFREALATGPAPQGLSDDKWFAIRARHLAGMAGKEADRIEQDLKTQAATIAQLSQHDEIILWFEHDLFCQINLIYLLDYFARHPVTPARLSLICINAFPGKPKFRGLGELTAEQMASLFDTRHTISDAEFKLAQRAWAAYGAADPSDLANLCNENTAALPYLREALWLHMARFPAVNNGLGRTENRVLSLIAAGQTEYLKLCGAFFDAEPVYGLGDTAIQQDLTRLADAPHPLVTLTGLDEKADWHQVTCSLTAAGQQVLANETDFIKLNGIELWLGGVHLTNENLWRWNKPIQRVERVQR